MLKKLVITGILFSVVQSNAYTVNCTSRGGKKITLDVSDTVNEINSVSVDGTKATATVEKSDRSDIFFTISGAAFRLRHGNLAQADSTGMYQSVPCILSAEPKSEF